MGHRAGSGCLIRLVGTEGFFAPVSHYMPFYLKKNYFDILCLLIKRVLIYLQLIIVFFVCKISIKSER